MIERGATLKAAASWLLLNLRLLVAAYEKDGGYVRVPAPVSTRGKYRIAKSR